MKKNFFIAAIVFLTISFSLSTSQAEEKDYSKPQDLVDNSVNVIKRFGAEKDMTAFRGLVKSAKAVFVVPQMLRGGFIFGGSGGSGALVARDEKTEAWGYPVFYTMGSVSFGLQIGADASQIVLLVMTEKGMDSLLTSSFKVGADVSVAAGPVGVGAKAATADILAYTQSKGAYGGATIEGAVIKVRDEWNSSYYGKDVTPADVIVRQTVANFNANPLRQVIAELTAP